VSTGRLIINNEDDLNNLCNLGRPEIEYLNIQPANHQFIIPNLLLQRTAELQCIDDVRNWAFTIGISPVQIDRILYMVGSGNAPNINLQANQFDRYRDFLDSLNLLNY
jgi:hypothetical protein